MSTLDLLILRTVPFLTLACWGRNILQAKDVEDTSLKMVQQMGSWRTGLRKSLWMSSSVYVDDLHTSTVFFTDILPGLFTAIFKHLVYDLWHLFQNLYSLRHGWRDPYLTWPLLVLEIRNKEKVIIRRSLCRFLSIPDPFLNVDVSIIPLQLYTICQFLCRTKFTCTWQWAYTKNMIKEAWEPSQINATFLKIVFHQRDLMMFIWSLRKAESTA